jgi:hypothetical protein
MKKIGNVEMTPGRIAVLVFTLSYILLAGIYFLIADEAEFLLYLLVLLILMAVVARTLPRTKLPVWALWMLSILGLMHVAGGGVQIAGEPLYNQILIPILDGGENGITLWRYDQLVHPYGTLTASLIFYWFLAPYTKLKCKWIALFAALTAMGIGALNEVVEFIAKVFIPDTNVGGYNNTALDLVMNALGATIGAIIAWVTWGKKPPHE